jgi:hypothetical protein
LFPRDSDEDFFESGLVPVLRQNAAGDLDWRPVCNDPAMVKKHNSIAYSLNFGHVV